MMAKRIHVNVGDRYGRLTVICELESIGQRMVLCRCDCGDKRIAVLSELRRGNTKSCGCLSRELRSIAVGRRSITHGESDCKTHRIWRAMKSRCNNPRVHNYQDYGGRGISVCPQWEKSYEMFIADMGHCPSGASIDRIDNDGNYEPGNCRWATRADQNRNRRDNVMLTFAGKTMCLTDWASEIGMNERTLRNRIKHYGWSIKDALTIPVGQKRIELTTDPEGVDYDVPFDGAES